MVIDRAILGRRLKQARENCGASQDEVARLLGIPRSAVSLIEAGARNVSSVEISKLADHYGCLVADLFAETDEPREDVLVALRAVPGMVENPAVLKALGRYVLICREGAELGKVLGIGPRSGPPNYDLEPPSAVMDAVRQGQMLAREERRRFSVGDHPIPDPARLISNEGIWVSRATLPDDISGSFLCQHDIGMVILVNSDNHPNRRRFSYAHEYAHALVDRNRSASVSKLDARNELREVRANAFAAAFLLPEDAVRQFLASLGKTRPAREDFPVFDLATENTGAVAIDAKERHSAFEQSIASHDVTALSLYFHVSYLVAAYRLRGLNLIRSDELKSLLSQKEKEQRFRRLLKLPDEASNGAEAEEPELEARILILALEAYRRGEISQGKLRDLAKLLKLSPQGVLSLAS